MLKASISKFTDHEDNHYYLFNVDDEEVRYSFPLNTTELMIFADGLDGCIYQGVKDLQLELYKFNVNDRRKYVTISFISEIPMMSFRFQKAVAVSVLGEAKKILKEQNLL